MKIIKEAGKTSNEMNLPFSEEEKIDYLKQNLQKGDYNSSKELVAIAHKYNYLVGKISLLLKEAESKETRVEAKTALRQDIDSLCHLVNKDNSHEKISKLENKVNAIENKFYRHENPPLNPYWNAGFTLFLCGALYLASSILYTDIKTQNIEKKLFNLKSGKKHAIILKPASMPLLDMYPEGLPEDVEYTPEKEIIELNHEQNIERQAEKPTVTAQTSQKPYTSAVKKQALKDHKPADYSREIKLMESDMRLFEGNIEGMKVMLEMKGFDSEKYTKEFRDYSKTFWSSDDYGAKKKGYESAKAISFGRVR